MMLIALNKNPMNVKMNISNINNFINVKNNILKCFVHEVAQATDVSVTVARIYRWRNERSEFFIYR